METYGAPVYVINLLRYLKVGKELKLSTEFVRQINECAELRDSIKYVNFDFHGYCGGDRYQNLKVLMAAVQSDVLN